MIKIKYNNECYIITQESKGFVWDVACADYDASIVDHVDSIIAILATCNVEYELEEL